MVFWGYLSARFSGLSQKKQYFSPSLSHPSKTLFWISSYPWSEYPVPNIHLNIHQKNSTYQSDDYYFAPPLPYHTTSCLSRQPQSAPYSRQKPVYKGFYRIGNKKGRMQTIQPSDVNFRQASPLPYTLKIKRHVSPCKRFVLHGPMQPSRITLW